MVTKEACANAVTEVGGIRLPLRSLNERLRQLEQVKAVRGDTTLFVVRQQRQEWRPSQLTEQGGGHLRI